MEMLHTLPPEAQKAVMAVLDQEHKDEQEAREAQRESRYEARDDDTQNLRLGQG
jgi:hypothetical protein